MSDRISSLILAVEDPADAEPTALLEWGGVPLLQHAVAAARDWPVDELVVVIGAAEDRILERIDFVGCVVVVDPGWREGSASLLRVGLDALRRESGMAAAVIARSDEPGVDRQVVADLVAAYRRPGHIAAVPKYRYAAGLPAVIDESLWPRLMGMEGDVDVVQFLQTHPEWVTEVWVDRLPPRRVTGATDIARLPPRR